MTRDGRQARLQSSAPRAIEWAADTLATGGVIALPTDTVYGIAASLSQPAAIERIYELKGRPDANPLPVLVSSPDEIEHLTLATSPDVGLLLDQLWPGPLTVVLPARPGISERVTAGGTTIGVRMPNHPLAIEVIARAGGAIACTSANLSGQPPALNADEVEAAFADRLDLILDGGIAPGGVASTVVDLSSGAIRFLRAGAIPGEVISARWDELRAGHRRH